MSHSVVVLTFLGSIASVCSLSLSPSVDTSNVCGVMLKNFSTSRQGAAFVRTFRSFIRSIMPSSIRSHDLHFSLLPMLVAFNVILPQGIRVSAESKFGLHVVRLSLSLSCVGRCRRRRRRGMNSLRYSCRSGRLNVSSRWRRGFTLIIDMIVLFSSIFF